MRWGQFLRKQRLSGDLRGRAPRELGQHGWEAGPGASGARGHIQLQETPILTETVELPGAERERRANRKSVMKNSQREARLRPSIKAVHTRIDKTAVTVVVL